MTRIQERILADLLMLIRVNPPEIRVIRVQFCFYLQYELVWGAGATQLNTN